MIVLIVIDSIKARNVIYLSWIEKCLQNDITILINRNILLHFEPAHTHLRHVRWLSIQFEATVATTHTKNLIQPEHVCHPETR